MKNWASVHRHDAEDITLLCPQHHRDRTSGLLPLASVAAWNASPHNRRTGVSSAYDLQFSGSQCKIILGSNTFIASRPPGYDTVLVPVMVDGVALLAFSLLEDELLLDFLHLDHRHVLSLAIEENALTYSAGLWDVEFVGRRLMLRPIAGAVILDVEFEPPSTIKVNKARFHLNGVHVMVDAEGVRIPNISYELQSNAALGSFGIVVGVDPPPGPCLRWIPNVPRHM
jgi:hypothetical protein